MTSLTLISFVLTLSLLIGAPINCAVFENVNVSLTTQWQKLFFYGQPPVETIVIASADSLSQYVNLQPLEIVSIADQDITGLKENSLANLHNIESIHITSSGVKIIEPGTFKNVPKLDIVNLSGNRIEEIEDGVFTNLPLRTLYLNDNKIAKLGSAAFSNMTFLTVLVLSYNKIATWDSDWFLGTPVSNLYLADNLIEELPADVFGYSYAFKKPNVPLVVWNFVLTDNKLRKVDENAFRHVNGFGVISLANNSLESLPRNVFHSVKSVNVLDLTNNQIATVDGLFDDININSLFLGKNRLSCFPTEIFDVSRIGNLYVAQNPFTCDCVGHWEEWQDQNKVFLVYLKYLQKKCV